MTIFFINNILLSWECWGWVLVVFDECVEFTFSFENWRRSSVSHKMSLASPPCFQDFGGCMVSGLQSMKECCVNVVPPGGDRDLYLSVKKYLEGTQYSLMDTQITLKALSSDLLELLAQNCVSRVLISLYIIVWVTVHVVHIKWYFPVALAGFVVGLWQVSGRHWSETSSPLARPTLRHTFIHHSPWHVDTPPSISYGCVCLCGRAHCPFCVAIW